MSQFKELSGELIKAFESYLSHEALPQPEELNPVWSKLWEAQSYSLSSGGKRFRPLLSLYAAHSLGVSIQQVLPFAAAVEMIHTYSLIHDDLPCLDNDVERRGKPTNHVKFGEDMALLAGDALLTEAFDLLARAYNEKPVIGLKLVGLLARAAGSRGMIGGQVMDISADLNFKNENINLIHKLKTGALIRVSIEAVAIIGGMDEKWQSQLREFGEHLGFAFQLADDILDHDPVKPESTSFIAAYGLERTKFQLNAVSDSALEILEALGLTRSPLFELVSFNKSRSH